MFRSIVLSGDSSDALTAARWAASEARQANYAETLSDALAARVLRSYRAACNAFFGVDRGRQKLMISLDLSRATPRFELLSDGEQARGAVASARGLRKAERRRGDLLDGLTCVSVPA